MALIPSLCPSERTISFKVDSKEVNAVKIADFEEDFNPHKFIPVLILGTEVLLDKEMFIKRFSYDGRARDRILLLFEKTLLIVDEVSEVISDYEREKKALIASVGDFGHRYGILSEALLHDRDVALAFVKCNGNHLELFPEVMRDDEEIVSHAIARHGYAFRYASERLRASKELLLKALETETCSLQYATGDLNKDKVFVQDLKKRFGPDIQRYASRSLQLAFRFEDALKEANPKTKELYQHLENAFLSELHLPNEDQLVLTLFSVLKKGKKHLEAVLEKVEKITCTSAQKRKMIIPLFLITAKEMDEAEKQATLDHFINNYKLFKDQKKFKTLLLFLLVLNDSWIPKPDQTKLLTTILGLKKDEIIPSLAIATSIFSCDKCLLKDLNKEDIHPIGLASLLLKKLKDNDFLPSESEIENLELKFLETFLHSRDPKAIFSYCSHKRDPEMTKAIRKFIKGVITGSFKHERNIANSCRDYLTETQRKNWEESCTHHFDLDSFLEESLIHHDHGLAIIRKGVFSDSTSPSTDDEAPLGGAGAPMKAVLNPLEKEVMDLRKCTTKRELIYAMEELKMHLESFELPFKDDVAQALEQLKMETTSEKNFQLVDSDDPFDLFLCGTEVIGSCQSAEAGESYNRALMGYVLDGKVRILAMKNATGKIVSRAILKIMLQDDKPALMLEKIYGFTPFEKEIRDLAKQKAKAMGLKLYEYAPTFPEAYLQSPGNVAPYEYEDAGVGVASGPYTISVKECV